MRSDFRFKPLTIFHPHTQSLVVQSCATHCCSRIHNLSVKIGSRILLDDVTLHLHCGELIGVVGPNGAGKSTLLRALIGEIPYTGKVEFLDTTGAIHPSPKLGYVPQNPRFEASLPLTVLDLFTATLSKRPLWLGKNARVRKRVEELLCTVQAETLIDQKIGTLSGGELQRVLLALALEPRPNLLLLDEPVSGMDANGRRMFYHLVDKVRKTFDLAVLFVSHDFGELQEFANRMVLLDGRIICEGKPSEVFSNPLFVERFGSEMIT